MYKPTMTIRAINIEIMIKVLFFHCRATDKLKKCIIHWVQVTTCQKLPAVGGGVVIWYIAIFDSIQTYTDNDYPKRHKDYLKNIIYNRIMCGQIPIKVFIRDGGAVKAINIEKMSSNLPYVVMIKLYRSVLYESNKNSDYIT
uniref:Uncharacterized protein n=1 Tax=Romanomermis culicivorax TaxID=13658 RepID=A0A915HKU4_ROMCU